MIKSMNKNLLPVQSLFVSLVLTLLAFNTHAQSVTRLVGCTAFQDSLWVFDTTSMAAIRGIAPTPSSGAPIEGMTALTKHPVTGAIYIVSKQTAVVGRTLGTINLNTGLVTIIGNLGDNFSSLTFNGNNTLLGVTGDGATVPETLFRINTSDASTTMIAALGLGLDGEMICYNPTDNMIYHWSGNGTVEYEKFDTSAITHTLIPITGPPSGETFGIVHTGGNTFLGSNINSSFNHWDTSGNVDTSFGLASDDIRGMAFITCDRAIAGTLSFCIGDSTLLTMTAGGTSYQWYRNGVAIAGATSQTYYATQAGSYNSAIIDMCSSSASTGDSLTTGVVVQELALPSVALTGNSSFCTGDSTLLTGTSGGTSQWFLNGSPIVGATNNIYYATASGNYNMTKTNLNGCSDSSTVGIIVTVNPLPVVALSAQSLTSCINETTNLLTGSPGGGTYSGPGVTGNNFNPSVAGAGTHDVIYTYTDSSGCTNTDTIQIFVDLCTGISQTANADRITFDNPFSNTLSLDLATFAEGMVSILNTMGQQVVSATIDAPRITLNTSSLSRGIYFIRITTNKGVSVYRGVKE
jgi:hypothetical protein